MFHKEGHKIIAYTILGVILVNIISFLFLETLWLQKIIGIVSVVLVFMILQFFRNPTRTNSIDEHNIMAPVDGKVVVIEEIFDDEYFKDKRLQVSIFMSPINVHVTRHPVSGKVVYSKYHPGKYLVAWHPKSSQENERTTVVVKNNTIGKILYKQIAGAMAKRIVNYAELGKEVVQGSDSGFIKFGSRVDVLLPLDTKIDVTLNQKVKGGLTVIANI